MDDENAAGKESSGHEQFEAGLKKLATTWFVAKNFPVSKRHPFVLAERKLWPSNIILSEVADYIKQLKKHKQDTHQHFPLHKYIHHGLSSQALLFNLLGPLVIRKHLSPLQKALAEVGIPWPSGNLSATFEFDDRLVFNETRGQPTSVDLVIKPERGAGGLFIEAKFVEREFGGCSVFQRGDCDGRNPARNPRLCYLTRIKRTYWDRLAEHGFLTGSFAESPICPLALYYQYFREVLFALHSGGHFVLLHDARNPTFRSATSERGLFAFLHSWLPTDVHTRVTEISIQKVFGAIACDPTNSNWTKEFAVRYGIPLLPMGRRWADDWREDNSQSI